MIEGALSEFLTANWRKWSLIHAVQIEMRAGRTQERNGENPVFFCVTDPCATGSLSAARSPGTGMVQVSSFSGG